VILYDRSGRRRSSDSRFPTRPELPNRGKKVPYPPSTLSSSLFFFKISTSLLSSNRTTKRLEDRQHVFEAPTTEVDLGDTGRSSGWEHAVVVGCAPPTKVTCCLLLSCLVLFPQSIFRFLHQYFHDGMIGFLARFRFRVRVRLTGENCDARQTQVESRRMPLAISRSRMTSTGERRLSGVYHSTGRDKRRCEGRVCTDAVIARSPTSRSTSPSTGCPLPSSGRSES